MTVRTAVEADREPLAALWYAGWQDGQGGLVPEELERARTPESFRDRLTRVLDTVRVVGDVGAPVGMCMIDGDELIQLYVSREVRGGGVAAVLLADAEAQFAAAGVATAWLACAIGNHRAARFYEKHGWHLAGVATIDLEIPGKRLPIEVWRYEKAL